MGTDTDATGARLPSEGLPDPDALFRPQPIDLGDGLPEPGWIDYNGHMNVGYYGVAFDRLTERFYNTLHIGAAYVAETGMGPFALQAHQHFLDELRPDDRFRGEMLLLDCDHKRWRLFATLIRLRDGARAATLEQLSMNVDLAAHRSAPLPEAQAAALERVRMAHADLPRPPEVGAPLGIRRKPA